MSRIKNLKNEESNNINLIDLFSTILVSDKTKYIEQFTKLIKKHISENYVSYKTNTINEYLKRFRKPDDDNFKELSILEVLLLSNVIQMTDVENIESFNKFCEYNERNLIDKNDITSYKSFDDINNVISVAELKLINKELEKQIIKLYEDDQWLIIRPLSYESSKKYGSNTKWCTTSAASPEYFFRYFRNGILIYCLNKRTGYKVAVNKNFKEKEVCFWNQKDVKIDSFYTELPATIIELLRKELLSTKSNYDFADPMEVNKEMNNYHIAYEVPRRIRRTAGGIRLENRFDDGIERQPIGEMEQPIGEMEQPIGEMEQPIGEMDMNIVDLRTRGRELNITEEEEDVPEFVIQHLKVAYSDGLLLGRTDAARVPDPPMDENRPIVPTERNIPMEQDVDVEMGLELDDLISDWPQEERNWPQERIG